MIINAGAAIDHHALKVDRFSILRKMDGISYNVP